MKQERKEDQKPDREKRQSVWGESSRKEYLAIDIGASSGRHILGWVENGKIRLEEIHRFQNGYHQKNGRDCWDIAGLRREILIGLKRCKELGRIPVSVGIDTWGVDFVLLDAQGEILGDAVAYRDARSLGMDKELEKRLSFQALYEKTGIQKQSFNTIYQLTALQRSNPEQLTRAQDFLMIPDYLHYCLTGKKVNEYTEATTSAMINAETKDWDPDLLACLGVSPRLFRTPSMPGTRLGQLSQTVQQEVGFDCQVVLPASHDTGSAFLAVPAMDEGAVFLSSGTWSLLGIERRGPDTGAAGRAANFTNEGGYQGRFRYLKNIMGLWMIQSIRREEGRVHSFAQLEALARASGECQSLVDVQDERFLAPVSMTEEIRRACRESGQAVPESLGQLMQCVYRSLAVGYRDAIQVLEALTGTKRSAVNIVGGGSQDGYLNQLTADETGLPVYAGPTEGTALGNLMVQMLTDGVFKELQEARDSVRESFPIGVFKPKGMASDRDPQ